MQLKTNDFIAVKTLRLEYMLIKDLFITNNTAIYFNIINVEPFGEIHNLELYNINIKDAYILTELAYFKNIGILNIANVFVNNSYIDNPLF